jgi:hypothetical protein
LAEVVSYLTLLTPLPLSRLLKISRLGVSTAKTLRVARVSLEGLGVDMARYGERDYALTQSVGAALAFLGLDGLIAPSPRGPCDNLMIYQSNHMVLTERLEMIEEEQVDWGAWARTNGVLAPEPAPPDRRKDAAMRPLCTERADAIGLKWPSAAWRWAPGRGVAA